jgi:hypothetical protein
VAWWEEAVKIRRIVQTNDPEFRAIFFIGQQSPNVYFSQNPLSLYTIGLTCQSTALEYPFQHSNPSKMKPTLVLSLFVAPLSVHAATLSVGYQPIVPNSTAATSYALPSGPGTDWGYYQQLGDPGAFNTSASATNSADFDGDRNFVLSTIGGGNLRGPGNITTGAPLSFFDYTNGEFPVSGNDFRPTGLFNSQLGAAGATLKAGVQMNLTSFTGPSQIQIWTYGFDATGRFEVFVNGSTTASYFQDVTVTSVSTPLAGKSAQLFTLDFTPDNEFSSLDIVYRMTASTNTASHVGFQAIVVSPIPEPAAVSLLGIAGALGLIRRRR